MKRVLLPVLAAFLFLAAPAAAKDEKGAKILEKALRKPAAALSSKLHGRVCVIDFSELAAPDYTSEFGQKVADLLSNGLVNRKRKAYQVVERRELIKILRDSILLVGDDEDAMASLQKTAGMDVLVSGSYSAIGNEVSINVKAVDARTGGLLASASTRLKTTEGLAQMLSRRFKSEDGGDDAPGGQAADVLEVETGVFYEGGDGKLYPLREGMVLGSKDNYAIYVKPKRPCHLYIYQVDSSRKAFKLFPNPELATESNPLVGSKEYWIPNGKEFLYLDNNPGREEIYVFATRAPAEGLESIKEARLSDIQAAIRTMGVAGKRGSETLSKVRGTQGNALELVLRRLAAQGDFYYQLSFIHQ